MLDTDGYLRLAASNFKIAEAHLKDAEDELHKLLEKLEGCLEIMAKLPKDELLLWEQVDTIVRDSEPVNIDEPDPVYL